MTFRLAPVRVLLLESQRSTYPQCNITDSTVVSSQYNCNEGLHHIFKTIRYPDFLCPLQGYHLLMHSQTHNLSCFCSQHYMCCNSEKSPQFISMRKSPSNSSNYVFFNNSRTTHRLYVKYCYTRSCNTINDTRRTLLKISRLHNCSYSYSCAH